MDYQNSTGGFLAGAILGGLIGGVAGLLIAPKSGKQLRDDLSETYGSWNEKSHDLTEDLKNRARHLLECEECDEDDEGFFSGNTPFLAGGSVGAVLGALSALLLAPESGKRLRRDLGGKYHDIRERAEGFVDNLQSKGRSAIDQVDGWKEALSSIVEKLSSAKGRKGGHSKIDEIVDWATLGLHLLQKVQHRK